MTVTIRYWAAAAAATGVDSEESAPGVLADLLGEAVARHPDLDRVLQMASVLVEGTPTRVGDRADVEVPEGATVEILPPFAGG